MRQAILAAIAAAILCVSAAVHADDAITAVNNEVGLSIGGENISYHEASDGGELPDGPDGYLDSQIRTMPALSLNVTRQGALFGVSNVYLSLAVSGSAGKTQYVGSAEVPHCNGIPGTSSFCSMESFTNEEVAERDNESSLDASGRVGKASQFGARAQITPYVEFGAHAWNRNLSFMNGNDVYWNLSGGVGVLGQYALTNRLVVGLDLGALESFAANAHENGVDFHLGSRPMLTGALSADYAATKHLHLTANYSVAHYRYGGSPSVCIGESCSFEPDSWTTTQTVMVGIAYSYR
jgi:hypothetical protein